MPERADTVDGKGLTRIDQGSTKDWPRIDQARPEWADTVDCEVEEASDKDWPSSAAQNRQGLCKEWVGVFQL